MKSIVYVIKHARFQLYEEYSDLYLKKLTINDKYINKQIRLSIDPPFLSTPAEAIPESS